MASASFSLRFYLNNRKLAAGKQRVYLRVIVDRKKVEIATNYSLHEKDWDDTRQRAKKDSQVNDSLVEMEKSIYNLLYTLQKEKKPVSAVALKQIYLGKSDVEISLLAYYDAYIESIKAANEITHKSILRYHATRAYLHDFLSKIGNINIPISGIDFKTISDFDQYLISFRNSKNEVLGRNTVNKYHARLKTVLLRAFNEGLLGKNPYYNFKLKYVPTNRTFLTREELDKIQDYSLAHNKTLEKVKDIFLFSVYTGLRFEDAQNLKANQISRNSKKETFLQLVQEKTGQQLQIPMLKPAVEVYNKYNNAERKITGFVLPRISNQKFNLYLKEIGVIVGIEKVLTHHVARHTCATTILLSQEAPIEVVSKWLGHTNIKTTQIYAKITGEYLSMVARKIDHKIAK